MTNNHFSNNSKIFWITFWITIIILATLYVGAKIEVYKIFQIYQDKSKNETISESKIFNRFYKKINNPKIIDGFEKALEKSQGEIENIIYYEIDKAFESVYYHIDDFINFHYSVTGEYTELAEIIFQKTSSALKEHLFKPANFNENIQKAIDNINEKALFIIRSNLQQTKHFLKEDMKLSDQEANFLFKVLQISKEDTVARFSNISYDVLRSSGVLVGALGASLGAKIFAKKMGKVLATKLTAKVAVKTGTKVAGSGGAAATGASVGAVLGGPVGATIGGVAGAIIGWFATDKIVIEIDQLLNEDEFKEEIVQIINQQKDLTKRTIIETYLQILDTLKENQQQAVRGGIEKLKNVKIKDIIEQ